MHFCPEFNQLKVYKVKSVYKVAMMTIKTCQGIVDICQYLLDFNCNRCASLSMCEWTSDPCMVNIIMYTVWLLTIIVLGHVKLFSLPKHEYLQKCKKHQTK